MCLFLKIYFALPAILDLFFLPLNSMFAFSIKDKCHAALEFGKLGILCGSIVKILRGVKLIFTEGHFNIMAAIKGPVVTVRLYKYYYSLTYC